MLSTKDYEKLWFLYKLEGEPRNLSVDEFCRMQGVPAESFNKWLDRRRKKIVEVQVEGIPESPSPETPSPSKDSSPEVPSPVKKATTVIKSVNIVIHGGTLIAKRNLSYQGLRDLVEKLEVLC